MISIPRYVVGPWIVYGNRYYTVWDIQTGAKHVGSAYWKTERFAKEDADELNREGGETDEFRSLY